MARKRKFNTSLSRWFRANLPSFGKAIKGAQATGLSGSEKLDHAASLLNTLVDVPLLPEFVEQMMFKTALTALVELAKAVWGKNDWFEQLMRNLDLWTDEDDAAADA